MGVSYEPLGSRALGAQIMLGVCAVLDLTTIAHRVQEISLMKQVSQLNDDTMGAFIDTIDASDTFRLTLGIIHLVALVGSAVAFIMWFHLAYENLYPLGRFSTEYSTGTATWAWFVPFLNLWRPYRIAQETWMSSYPEWRAPGTAPGRSGFVIVWWGLWLVHGLFSRISARMPADTAEALIKSDDFEIFACVVSIAAALAAIAVVQTITTRQAEHWDYLGERREDAE